MIYKIVNKDSFNECLRNIKETDLFDINFITELVDNICISLCIEQSSSSEFKYFMEDDCLKSCPVYVITDDTTPEMIYEALGINSKFISMYEYIENILDIEGNIIAYKAVYITSDDGSGISVFVTSNNELFTEMKNHSN